MHGIGNQHLRLDGMIVEERMTALGSDLGLRKAKFFGCESYILVAPH